MRKLFFKSMVALAALCLGTMNVAAQEVKTGTATVKMTYVDQSFPDSIVGAVDTIRAGYNNAPAVGSTVPFGRTSWGCNWIGVLKVDVSSIPGTVQKATLKAQISGSTDSKRGTSWGVALTDNAWAADLNYTTVGTWTVSALLNGGKAVNNTQNAATVFEDAEWDITEALSSGQATATLLVYETAAAGGYMTGAYVEVEYEPFESTNKGIDFEDEDVSMFVNVNPSRMTISAVDDATLNSKVAQFAATNRNALPMGFYDFTELTGKASKVAIEFDFLMNSVAGHHKITIGDALVHNAESGGFNVTSKNNYGYGANGAIFYFGTDRGNLGGGNENYFKINNTAAAASTLDIKADSVFGHWCHAKVMVDVDNKLVSYEISRDDIVLFEGNGEPFASDAANSCTEFDVSFSNTGTSFIDNLSITNYKSNAVFADYTIKYVDSEGNELKEARTGNGQVGKYVTLLDSDKASIYNEDKTKKYLYDSDDSEAMPITEEGTVITVKFRDAEIYYAVLNCVIDGQTMATGKLEQFRDNDKYWFFEGDNFSIRPAIAYGKDGKYYTVQPDSYNGKVFTFPGSVSPAVNGGKTYYIGTLYYTLDETIAYHSDFERLALPVEDAGNGTGLGQLVGTVNNWWSFSNGYFDRFSQGRGIRLDTGSYVYTEPIAEEGTYMVTIYGRNDRSENCTAPYALGLRDTEGNVTLLDVAVPDWSSATTGASVIGNAEVEAQEPTEEGGEAVEAVAAAGIGIPAGYSLVVMNTGNGNMISLDDIRLTKVADYAETPSLNIYTATFTTDAEWENVYAYAWTTVGEGEEAVTTEFLGAWPGTQLKATDGVYTVSIISAEAPANIIFNNGNSGDGNQTKDLVFQDKKAYSYLVPFVFPDNATVFDFEAAAAAGENPGNLNGSATNGQAFYGWEKVDKTDSKRQDYKGYTWEEGSVLPEVCQVWRRSDRINGNVKDNGLYCPNDREMAVDGLEPGSKVIVVYDAANATDKELIWAIGDGTSQDGPGTDRATATINGVDAVIGETTIASGAEILVNSVTPAENGTGYIVFQVKKGMYIRQIAVIPATATATYTVAGAVKVGEEEQAAFFGEAWSAEVEANDMTLGEDGVYTLTFDKVKFEAPCTILYKVVKDHAWTTSWGFNATDENPNANADYVVNKAGVYNVTFYFNPDAQLENGFNVHCVLEGIKGDVNGDGEVGIGDIVAITNVMAGIEKDPDVIARANVNGDDSVGIGDIVAITNIMAGVATEEPAEEPAQE